MNLSTRFLSNVANVNSFIYVDRPTFTEGDTSDVYLQLIDKELDTPAFNYYPPYRRFVPIAGSTLIVVLMSLDSTRVVTKAATQPFVGDASIWKFSVTPSDRLRGSVNMRIQLNQNGVITNALIQPAINILAKGQ